ncbi:MAG: glycoside hydrolase family 2 TIM barrel-domain containing protein [Steroidobacter sp.]
MKNTFIFLLIATIIITMKMAAADTAIQNPSARASISLDGKWDVIVDPYENGYYNHRYEESDSGYFRNAKPNSPGDLVEYNFATSPKLNVPGDWNTQDDKLFWYEGTIWYHRDVELNAETTRQYLLYFGAVNYKAIVYVNGRKAGSHEGGFTPFQFDISALIRNGTNSIVVKVDNRRERDQVPTVNTDWWNYGGITRSVKILTVPQQHIDDYLVQLDHNHSDVITGWVHVTHTDTTSHQQVALNIPELHINEQVVIGADGVAKFSIHAKPTLWSFENPKLYTVKLQNGGEVIEDQIGFRTIAVSGEDILLNGKPVFLKGISIHEESPLHPGRAWSDEDAEQLLTWARELGCNYVRLAHYPHNETMLRMADKMGLMVWSEIPVYWTVMFDNPAVYDKAELQLREMITRDKNRASIVLWSIANETPNSAERLKFLTRLIQAARTLDSSRLITAAMDTQSDDHGSKVIDDPLASQVDVIGINTYCGWYSGTPESCASLKWISHYHKPAIVSEFGADALQGMHGDKQQRFTEEYQAEVYKQNLLMLDQMSFLRGVSPWILKDFRSPRRPLSGIQDYWNRKGLISDKGIKKQAWYVLQDYYRKK